MTKRILLAATLFCYSLTFGQNPVVPPGMYIADPSAHVWQDGKLYVYGSLDESTDYYCSWSHHVLSTTDLKTWKIFRDRFASKGPNDQVAGTDALLFAPDCQFRDGTYYLYYCLPDHNYSEGVAASEHPAGPFVDGQQIDLHGYNEIDPCVFMDDDGQAYYLWGQFSLKMAKLNPDMKTLDKSTFRKNIITEKEHYFHEGAYLIKRNNIYYLIYADISRGGVPSCLGYATSASPMGPYRYRGVIIDNDRCDPGNWNNHGSLVEFNHQWYVFYHRATHNSNRMRKACVEPIWFNDDGSISEVEMTTQGAADPLNAADKLDAERACLIFGNVRVEAIVENNEALVKIRNNDRAAYKYLNFNEGMKKVNLRVKPGQKGGKIEVTTDQSWHSPIASLDVPAGSQDSGWLTLSSEITPVQGVHALWLRFYGEGDDLFSLDWIQFE